MTMTIENFPPEILLTRIFFPALYSTFQPFPYNNKGKRHKSQKSRSNRRKNTLKAKNK